MGFSGDQVGLILASLKITYGLGQLLNGQLSERISPRLLLAIGMFGSATLNVVFGLGSGFYFLLSYGLRTAIASRSAGHLVFVSLVTGYPPTGGERRLDSSEPGIS